MKINQILKKGLAIVLTSCMVVGTVPGMPGTAKEVKAASVVPSISVYATKEELMSKFSLASAAGKKNQGYINFGRDSNGTAEKWHILGADTGIAGDNVVLFASGPIQSHQKFADISGEKDKVYDESWGCNYADGAPAKVFPNHYGGSTVRQLLKNMLEEEGANNTQYFTIGEQNLMNYTTITTTDMSNGGITYTVKDKLYLGSGFYDASKDDEIWFGTNDDLGVDKQYWGNDKFWLRSPREITGRYDGALMASPNAFVSCDTVAGMQGVRPAFNLNLTSVLFASAAGTSTAVMPRNSGTITAENGMNLKLDGGNKLAGRSVTYNNEKITYDAIQGDVLVVQGHDGEREWYYSQYVEETSVNNASISQNDIQAQFGSTITVSDLSDCQVWLERTISDITAKDYGQTYAIMGTRSPVKSITNVKLTLDAPIAGQILDETVASRTKGLANTSVTWYSNGMAATSAAAAYNTTYTAQIYLGTASGYEFDDSVVVYLNEAKLGEDSFVRDANGGIIINYAFAATAKMKIMRIVNNYPRVFAVYHAAENVLEEKTTELPAYVTAMLEDGTQQSMAVRWTLADSYISDKNCYNEFAWTIAESEYAGIYDTNSLDMSGVVSIRNASKYAEMTYRAEGFSGIYDGQKHGISITVNNPADAIITYSTDAINYTTKNPTFTDAGSYQVYYKIEKNGYEMQSGMENVIIDKRNLTISASSQTVMWGESIDQTKYEVSGDGLLDGEAIAEVTLTPTTTTITTNGKVVPGMALIQDIRGVETTANYAITYEKGLLKITHNELLAPIGITASKTKVTYLTGERLSTDDIHVEVTYEDGYKETIKNFETNADSIDTTTGGSKILLVSYTKNGGTVSKTFTIQYNQGITILTQPEKVTIQAGNAATFKVSVQGTAPIQYQWMVNKRDGKGWNKITGAIANTYTTPVMNAEDNGYVYKCTINNPVGKVETNQAVLTVNPLPVTITGKSVHTYEDVIDVAQYFTIDANAGTPTYTLVTGTGGGTGEGMLSGTKLTVTKRGTFIIKLTTARNGNYAASGTAIVVTVSEKKDINALATGYAGAYDGQAHTINVSLTGVENAKITYSTDTGVDKVYSEQKPSFSAVGSYVVYYKVEAETYKTLVGYQQITITKRPITITADTQTITWNGTLNADEFNEHGYKITSGTLLPGDTISQIKLNPILNFTSSSIMISGVRIVNQAGVDVTDNYVFNYVAGILILGSDKGNAEDEAVGDTDEIYDDDDEWVDDDYWEEDDEETPYDEKNSNSADEELAVLNTKANYKLKITGSKVEATYVSPIKKNTTSITIPTTVKLSNGSSAKVTAIAANAFKNNKKVKKITIESNVESIGKQAFYGCKNLKKITIKSKKLTKKKVGSKAFKGIHKNAVIKVPKTKLKSYKTILKEKGAVGTVTIKK